MSTLSNQDVAAIKGSLEKFVAHCRKSDWDKTINLLTDDVVYLPPDMPILKGKKEVRKWFGEFPPIKAFESQILQTDGRDDFAWVRGLYTMTVQPEAGKHLSVKGKWTASYRKQPDGSWLMASDIWNLDEPAIEE